jgi:hypothetical protein
MSHDPPPDEFPFAGLTPPDPPAEMREKVLAVARRALAREAVPDVWTRIWESRPLRIAWAVAAVLLVIANVGISMRRPSGRAVVSRTEARTGAEAEREAARELAAVVALPPIDESVQPLAGRGSADALAPERNPSVPRGGLS